uniref:Uncharacterized protein n=1 Tax=Arundo donax TaxID=35708 RepID=A0A0A9HEW3_ARUDO
MLRMNSSIQVEPKRITPCFLFYHRQNKHNGTTFMRLTHHRHP